VVLLPGEQDELMLLNLPVKPPEGSPLHMLTDYYARKKCWNEQQRHG
jgi:hypothetical protein